MVESLDDSAKAGFARLLGSFESTDDVVKITKAFGLAARAHRGQLLNRAESYINHPLRVALILAEELQMRDAELVCAALLHDSLEAGVKEEEVQLYGERVSAAVRASMEPKAKAEERAGALEECFAKMAGASLDARYVKLADRLDSVRTMKNVAYKDRVARYKEEIQKYVMPLAAKTDERLALKLSVALYELK